MGSHTAAVAARLAPEGLEATLLVVVQLEAWADSAFERHAVEEARSRISRLGTL